MKNLSFSIIIPTYNRSTLLKDAIKSVFNQTFTDFEIIIIDDGSTDNTSKIVEQFERNEIKYYYQSNQGKSAARNKGMTLSKGQYICFLDSDDYYFENHLELLHSSILSNGFPVGTIRTGMITYRNALIDSKTDFFFESKFQNPVHFFALNSIGTNTVCIHRDVIESCLFDERWDFFQDTHFFLRILAKFPFHEICEYTCGCRIHKGRSSYHLFVSSDCELKTINNVNAIKNLFEEHQSLIQPHVPLWMKDYLVSSKYMDHATAYQAAGKLRLAWKYFIKAVQNDKRGWGVNRYLRFLPKFPLKVLFDYPKLPNEKD